MNPTNPMSPMSPVKVLVLQVCHQVLQVLQLQTATLATTMTIFVMMDAIRLSTTTMEGTAAKQVQRTIGICIATIANARIQGSPQLRVQLSNSNFVTLMKKHEKNICI